MTLEFDLEKLRPITEATVEITINSASVYGSNIVSLSSICQVPKSDGVADLSLMHRFETLHWSTRSWAWACCAIS